TVRIPQAENCKKIICTMTEDSGSAEETAAQRRERLKALREAQQLLDSEPPQQQTKVQPEQTEQDGKQDMKFRNYLPRDKELQQNRIAPPALPKFDDPVAAASSVPNGTEDPIVNIAPKKPNWDLRRDVQKKLDKLDRRTQRAIIELMYEEEKRRQEAAEENNLGAEED
ncbi:hypothetical protein KI387_016547, partial [Taxus chinensis]